jgi:hypothetical protein
MTGSYIFFSGTTCLPLCRNIFLVCPMKNAPVLVIKNSSNGDYKHITLPTDGEVGKHILVPGPLRVNIEKLGVAWE